MMLSELLSATWLTIYMVFISGLIAMFCGLWLGVLLYQLKNSSQRSTRILNQVLGFIVNAIRSIPYIIFMILLIPLTTLIIGTSIGTNASIVPLTLACIPFYARVAESALDKVPYGLIEAAQSMGASKRQIILKVLLPEAKPQLITGATLTMILLIGYSAMAGTIGGGGLGTLAIQYGYERFNIVVMLETVIVLIVMVQLIQSFGDYLAKGRSLVPLWLVTGILLIASTVQITASALPETHNDRKVISVGIMSGPQQEIMQTARKVAAERYDLDLKLVTFSDYNIPNRALSSGQIDANIFQHKPFLENQIADHGYQLSIIGKTFIYPMGLYSTQYDRVSQLPKGASIAIPSDPSNEGRALLLLKSAGLIKLKHGVSWRATMHDITANPDNLHIKTMAAAQIPRILDQVAAGAITNDYVSMANLGLQDAIYTESRDSPFANIIVVRTADKNRPVFKELVKVMHSQPVIKATEARFPNGAAIPAWKAQPEQAAQSAS